jgi:hypothetical protein
VLSLPSNFQKEDYSFKNTDIEYIKMGVSKFEVVTLNKQ